MVNLLEANRREWTNQTIAGSLEEAWRKKLKILKKIDNAWIESLAGHVYDESSH